MCLWDPFPAVSADGTWTAGSAFCSCSFTTFSPLWTCTSKCSKSASTVFSADTAAAALSSETRSACAYYIILTGCISSVYSNEQDSHFWIYSTTAKCTSNDGLCYIWTSIFFSIYCELLLFSCICYSDNFLYMIRFHFAGFLFLQFVPSSYPQQQPTSLVQPNSQMHVAGVPPAANTWPVPVNQSTSLVSPVQQTGQQTPVAVSTDPVSDYVYWSQICFGDLYWCLYLLLIMKPSLTKMRIISCWVVLIYKLWQPTYVFCHL